MGFFDNIFGKKEIDQYRTQEQQAANRKKQLEMTPQTLDVLRQHGVDNERVLRLEFFFYANAIEKAAKLSDKLTSLGYSKSTETNLWETCTVFLPYPKVSATNASYLIHQRHVTCVTCFV